MTLAGPTRGIQSFAIAHRLGTIVDLDPVMVLEQGRLIEFDDPRNLSERRSRFRELWEAQH